jgi:hypothetical protein
MRLCKPPHTGLSHDADVSFVSFVSCPDACLYAVGVRPPLCAGRSLPPRKIPGTNFYRICQLVLPGHISQHTDNLISFILHEPTVKQLGNQWFHVMYWSDGMLRQVNRSHCNWQQCNAVTSTHRPITRKNRAKLWSHFCIKLRTTPWR